MPHSKPRTLSLTLDDVQQQFQLWRANKSSGAKIPESLWELVSQLFANYKRSAIGKALGISTSQLRNKFPEQYKSEPTLMVVAPKKNKSFVQAPLDTLMASPLLSSSSTSPQLIIERNNGTKLMLSAVTDAQFSFLINAFMSECNSCCKLHHNTV